MFFNQRLFIPKRHYFTLSFFYLSSAVADTRRKYIRRRSYLHEATGSEHVCLFLLILVCDLRRAHPI